ncbi:hypothetical protein L596_016909 [Steinernema carpocapsae]|uniref:Uncharacterized protein n=1 Tax=Steinernema carpocapsae TaxID=34508 RepID=A0A4U5NJG0_STECR|nr:hypothetical protein L596_016909 [Steinernema carpocapsae]
MQEAPFASNSVNNKTSVLIRFIALKRLRVLGVRSIDPFHVFASSIAPNPVIVNRSECSPDISAVLNSVVERSFGFKEDVAQVPGYIDMRVVSRTDGRIGGQETPAKTSGSQRTEKTKAKRRGSMFEKRAVDSVALTMWETS